MLSANATSSLGEDSDGLVSEDEIDDNSRDSGYYKYICVLIIIHINKYNSNVNCKSKQNCDN